MAGDNRLASSLSPYLLQHADNPVDWRDWGDEALAEAQELDKPILLSVGYAACHWCHVMAHESFEDDATAEVMNKHFVNIKVDREQRPDVDQIYMAALHAMGEQGGWPLTMFLTPQGEPFYGGTYYPKRQMYGRPSFTQVLEAIARLYKDEPEKVIQNKDALTMHLASLHGSRGSTTTPLSINPDIIKLAGEQLTTMLDPDNGGMGGAPKFPNANILKLLLVDGHRSAQAERLSAVDLALTSMSQGGIYDHVGGGFARYTVDANWLIPHFEKMLYDNAQLVDLLSLRAAATGNPIFARRVRETIDWLQREMLQSNGAFAASLDADSEGEEGKFYVWSEVEIDEVLGPDSLFFKSVYDVGPGGNWEGKVILNRLGQRSLGNADTEDRLIACLERLLTVRDQRIRPGLDDKVLADWNGLMIAAIARAAQRLDMPNWLEMARSAFNGIVATMMNSDARLSHSARGGQMDHQGFASDYTNMASAALSLFEATGDPSYLQFAERFMETLDQFHAADDGGLHMSAHDATDLIVRPRAESDDAVPSAAGIAADVWTRLWILTGEVLHRDRVDQLFGALAKRIGDNVFASASLLSALDLRTNAVQVVIIGPSKSSMQSMAQAAYTSGHPNLVLQMMSAHQSLDQHHPAAEKLKALGLVSEATAFVCVGTRCSLPVTSYGDLTQLITSMVSE